MARNCLRCANCAAPDPCDGHVDEDGHCDMYRRAEVADYEKHNHPPTEQSVPVTEPLANAKERTEARYA